MIIISILDNMTCVCGNDEFNTLFYWCNTNKNKKNEEEEKFNNNNISIKHVLNTHEKTLKRPHTHTHIIRRTNINMRAADTNNLF